MVVLYHGWVRPFALCTMGDTDARHPARIDPTPGFEGTRRCTEPLLPTPRRDPGWIFNLTREQDYCARRTVTGALATPRHKDKISRKLGEKNPVCFRLSKIVSK